MNNAARIIVNGYRVDLILRAEAGGWNFEVVRTEPGLRLRRPVLGWTLGNKSDACKEARRILEASI